MMGWRQTGEFAYFSLGPGTNERVPGQRGKMHRGFCVQHGGNGDRMGKMALGRFIHNYFFTSIGWMDAAEADLHLHIPPLLGDFYTRGWICRDGQGEYVDVMNEKQRIILR